ncbi:multiple inositol polyphosphate phosphatase 1-like [Symsagittifera roscoffensis]|uniref:multiple inositol polyphosphate phosphatase 1-like n=1 Tax=Symsagittifera roscoffensis TaxID=84072 RepID=UPI00307CBACE
MCNVPFDKIYVDATYKERAYESAFWYVYGLLNLTDSSQFNFAFDGPQDATADSVKDGIEQLQQKLIFDINPPENDTVLRFYDACEKYVVSVDDNDTAMYQVTDFENTTTFQSSLQLLSDSFCAEGGLCSMNETILSNIYTACSHAQMMFNDYAPCEYIPQEVLETFEYCSDLKVYYKSYRGYNISYTSSCYLTRVITQDIQKAVKHDIIKRKKADEKECEQFEETAVNHDVTVKTGENEEIGDGSDQVFSHIVRAAHAETVLPVLGIMDAVYTEPLTADTYSIYRNFHSSRLAPMAANIIFTVYYSPERSQSRKPENSYFDNYFVTILLNERLLYLDGLNDPLRPNSPVPYKKFTQFLDTCSIEEFEKMCEETEEL